MVAYHVAMGNYNLILRVMGGKSAVGWILKKSQTDASHYDLYTDGTADLHPPST